MIEQVGPTDPLEELWAQHRQHCAACASGQSGCVVGDVIYHELLKRLDKMVEANA